MSLKNALKSVMEVQSEYFSADDGTQRLMRWLHILDSHALPRSCIRSPTAFLASVFESFLMVVAFRMYKSQFRLTNVPYLLGAILNNVESTLKFLTALVIFSTSIIMELIFFVFSDNESVLKCQVRNYYPGEFTVAS